MKRMKLSDQEVNKLMISIRELIKNAKSADGKINFSAPLPVPTGEKAELVISGIAYTKMRALVISQDKEVAWHGLVTKTKNDNVVTYKIEDIIVFPQTVTASTVVSDQEKYSLWLYSPEIHPMQKALRFHGHSHVNMACRPSAVDTKYQSDMIETLQDFYIFGIFNKRDENWIQIFDVEDNIIYEDADINLTIEENIFDWAAETVKELVKPHVYTPPTTSYLTTPSVSEKWQSTSAAEAKEAKGAKANGVGKLVAGRERTLEEQKKRNDQLLRQELADLKAYEDDYEKAYAQQDRDYKYFGGRKY